jgi:hypothetical protein
MWVQSPSGPPFMTDDCYCKDVTSENKRESFWNFVFFVFGLVAGTMLTVLEVIFIYGK